MDNIVERFKNGHFNKEEYEAMRKEIDTMSDKMLDEQLNMAEMSHEFSETEIDDLREQLDREIRHEAGKDRWYRVLGWAAAVMLPMLACVTALWVSTRVELDKCEDILANEIDISTSAGEWVDAALPDGSRVNLGPKSTLTYTLGAFNASSRKISYSGEGIFNIAKKTDSPFILSTSGFEIRVLGTEFSLMSRQDKTHSEIHLISGSIELQSLSTGNKLKMCPGETAVVDNSDGEIKILDVKSAKKISAGGNIMYFNSSPIAEVIEQLCLYYGLEFILDKSVPDITFTGSLVKDNLKEVEFVLETTMGLKFQAKDDKHIQVIK